MKEPRRAEDGSKYGRGALRAGFVGLVVLVGCAVDVSPGALSGSAPDAGATYDAGGGDAGKAPEAPALPDADAPDADAPDAEAPDAPPGIGPSSCAQAGAVEGQSIRLYWEGDRAKPFTADCVDGHAMIALPMPSGSAANFATYAGPTDTVRTEFAAIEVDATTGEIVVDNFSGSRSSGAVEHPNDVMADGDGFVRRVNFGVARDCSAPGYPAGRAEIDLAETPFAIAAEVEWKIGGFVPAGSAAITPDRKHALVIGGGFCGWNSPDGSESGGRIKIVYAGFIAP
jgi:hypothetical protein